MLKSPAPAFAGVPFDFGGGRVYVIPPISAGDFLELGKDAVGILSEPGAADMQQSVNLCIEVVYRCLRRNYPDMTRELIGELVDFSNFTDAVECCFDVKRLRREELTALYGPRPASPGDAG